MPQTLTLGSNAPDVILLQTTLNNRPPTALPLLLVDGEFGLVTLQRVQEFQTNNGISNQQRATGRRHSRPHYLGQAASKPNPKTGLLHTFRCTNCYCQCQSPHLVCLGMGTRK